MDFNDTPQEADFRAEVKAFLAANAERRKPGEAQGYRTAQAAPGALERAKAWQAKGASETYAAQLQSSKDQARAIVKDAEALRRNPEKLSQCLQLYFRIDGMEQMINSLVDGIRKYQDPALATQLASQSAENGANRNRFQAYIVSLATQQEQECAVMDQEAQRCRSIVATQPPPKPANQRKK